MDHIYPFINPHIFPLKTQTSHSSGAFPLLFARATVADITLQSRTEQVPWVGIFP